ncbi:branched-chain amino acid ABC transporter permease [Aquabacterium sp. J223]|uniref:branched-chain amino acid ABC transporter permease n=1 Tax=Aquabacterium sp. J223 TaxID=2898431 RepID=UPI0021AE2F0F|nr:branched-chain amino acid ABC transporter permease [Aquabacterium sp. J223]UUX94047.1 branched-chain amino acid ABC transporter permease [Aquabacterium sp. J223]
MAAALLTAPWWLGGGEQRLLLEVMVVLTVAQMWNLLAGYAGLVSFGQHAFIGIGAYAVYKATEVTGLSPYALVPLAGVLCGAVALAVAPLLFRLRDAYFSIGMWVFAECVRLYFSQWEWVGRFQGLTLALPDGLDQSLFIPVVCTLAVLLMLVGLGGMVVLLRLRYGLGLMAVRDNEDAAASIGLSVWRCRLVAFVVSSTITGACGATYYLSVLYIEPGAAFDMDWLVKMLFIVIVGGIGTIEGPILGTVVYFVLRELFSDAGSWYLILMGAIAMAVMLFAPKGLWGWLHDRYGWSLFPVRRQPPRSKPRPAQPDPPVELSARKTP